MLRYDPLSGQVFTERLVKTRDRLTNPSRPAEERRTPYEMQLEAERLKHLGVESLHAKAMRKLIVNARSLTPDALRATPAPITMQIWKEIIRENRVTLGVWNIFTNSGHADSTFVHSPRPMRLRGPHVVDTFSAISSPNFAWVTTLTLDSFLGTAADLNQVTRIVNLRSLEMRHTSPETETAFDDGIVEYWALRAGQALGEPFAVLRSLIIVGAPNITKYSFPSFQRFPSLQTLVLSETGIKHKHRHFASKCDWRIDTNGPFASMVKAGITSSRGNPRVYLCDVTRDYVFSLRSSSLSKDYNASAARTDTLPLLSMHFYGGRNMQRVVKTDLDDVLCFERKEAGATNEEEADEGNDEAGLFSVKGVFVFKGKKIKFEDESEVKEVNGGTKEVALPVLKKRKIRSGKEKELEGALGAMLSDGVSAGLGIFPTREG